MKNNYYIYTVFALLLLSFTACKQDASKTENASKTIVEVETPTKSTYDPAKGAHIIAPEMTKMLSDTLGIVMYELIMEPGDSLAWHQHPNHTFYVLEGGTLAVTFDGMERQVLELPSGFGAYGPPSGDVAVNIGKSTIKILAHDIYSLNSNE